MKYEEIVGDLFNMDEEYAFVHCISKDCKMGAGIAKVFNNKFPKMKQELLSVNPKITDALYYREGSREIFNLVTKGRYWEKPTYNDFTLSVLSLRDEVVTKNIRKIAMPMIGSGLDKLSWTKNREIVRAIFKNVDVEIVVCMLE